MKGIGFPTNPKAQQRKIKQNNKEDTLEKTTPFSQNIIVFYFVNMRARNGMQPQYLDS